MAGKGGARPGAGRKPKQISLARQAFAVSILDDELEKAMWTEMLNATRDTYVEGVGEPVTQPDYRIRLDALKYLSDQKHGKAPQAIELKPGYGLGLRLGSIPIPAEFHQPAGTNKPN